MTASSTSTYLDLTKAASGAESSSQVSQPEPDPETLAEAAKVLAAVHTGAQTVPELREKTGLGTDQIVAILAGLSKAGLVVLEDQNGSLQATLTEPTKEALAS